MIVVVVVASVPEFDTRVPHVYGSADGHPVELTGLFASDGARPRVRATTSIGEARPRVRTSAIG